MSDNTRTQCLKEELALEINDLFKKDHLNYENVFILYAEYIDKLPPIELLETVYATTQVLIDQEEGFGNAVDEELLTVCNAFRNAWNKAVEATPVPPAVTPVPGSEVGAARKIWALTKPVLEYVAGVGVLACVAYGVGNYVGTRAEYYSNKSV